MIDLTVRGYGQEAVRLVRSGQPAAAIPLCRRILDTFPKHVGTYGIMGQALFDLGRHDEATDLFRRVLGADPEHTLAHASLGAIYEERGLIDEAIWETERAFELSPGNREIRRALRRLYDQRSPVPVDRIKLTSGALARAYMRGLLYPKAIGELREVVAEHPNRYDLRVALAEALWHTRQYDQASIVCQGILLDLPNCLKANLILGHIWLNTQRDEEGRALLQRAQSLDPENRVARDMLGTESLLPPRVARLPFRDEDEVELDTALDYLRGDAKDDDMVLDGTVIERQPSEPAALDAVVSPKEPVPLDGPADEYVAVSSEPEIIPEPRAPEFRAPIMEAAEDEEQDAHAEPPAPSIEQLAEQVDVADSTQTIAPVEPDADMRHNEEPLAETPAVLIDTLDRPSSDDWRAHIERARTLRDTGAFDEAIAAYRATAEMGANARTEVQRELAMLNRLYPGQQAVHALLADLTE